MTSTKAIEKTEALRKKKGKKDSFEKEFAKWSSVILTDPTDLYKDEMDEEVYFSEYLLDRDPDNYQLKRRLADAKLFRSALDIPLMEKYIRKVKPMQKPENTKVTPQNSFNYDQLKIYLLWRWFSEKLSEENNSDKQQKNDNVDCNDECLSLGDRRQFL